MGVQLQVPHRMAINSHHGHKFKYDMYVSLNINMTESISFLWK